MKKKKRKRNRNSEGRANCDKFKWSQTNDWGKLNWNNQNEEEFEASDEEMGKIGENKKKDHRIRNAGDNRRGMKKQKQENRRKERDRG